VNWFDLDVADCFADPPPVDDPNVVGVNVLDRKCNKGSTKYTEEPVGSGTFSITCLIDSNQNCTSSDPDPSTVICPLQSAGGDVLTVPA
jgi:hypothetical protein